MENEFPGNSNAQKQGPKASVKAPTEKKVEKVVTGVVVQRKKSLGRKFKDMFIGGEGVLAYVYHDIMVPAAKDLAADAVSQGVERKLFGEARSTSRRGRPYVLGGGAGHSAYNRMYSGPSVVARREDPRAIPSRKPRNRHNFGEIILETRAEATEVIDQLFTLLAQYEQVTVADLYDLVGEDASYTDQAYGWTDLRGSDITRVRNGYLLDLPKPEPLD